MKDKTRLAITGIAAAAALALTVGGHGLNFSIGDDDEQGGWDDTKASRMVDLKGFDAVALAGPDDVIVTRGSSFSVKAEGEQGALDRLNLFVREGTLHVERKQTSGWGGGYGATIRVTLPALHRVKLTGPGDMSVDRLDGKDVKAEITGSGNLVIAALAAENAQLSLTGSGDLRAAGKARSLALSATGSGDIVADRLESDRASLKLTGSGDIRARALQGADVSIMGSGDVQVSGTTSCQISKVGPGEAQCTI